MAKTSPENYIAQKLATIQKRQNFHPELGAKQIQNCTDPEVNEAYKVFAALLEQISALGLDVQVPYDPAGLDPMSRLQQRKAAPRFVYFHVDSRKQVKIGNSANPSRRRRELQTGNPERMRPLYRIEGDMKLERAIKEYFRAYRSKGDGGTEWFAVTGVQVKALIQRIKAEGPDFLGREAAHRRRV